MENKCQDYHSVVPQKAHMYMNSVRQVSHVICDLIGYDQVV